MGLNVKGPCGHHLGEDTTHHLRGGFPFLFHADVLSLRAKTPPLQTFALGDFGSDSSPLPSRLKDVKGEKTPGGVLKKSPPPPV